MYENNYIAILIMALLGYSLVGWEYLALAWFPHWLDFIPPSFMNKLSTLLELTRPVSPILYVLAFVLQQYEKSGNTETQRLDWKWLSLFGCLFIASWVLILKYHQLGAITWIFLYPTAILITLLAGPVLGIQLGFQPQGNIKNPLLGKSEYGFHIPLKTGSIIPKGINISNPFRGVFISGAAGSGKSESLAKPIIWQAAKKGYTGILYDYKFPELANVAYTAYHYCPDDVTFYVINFTDLSRSHRVNPLHPRYLPSIAYADEYAQAIVSNLMPETIGKKDFWVRSATAILTATIWYMKKHHPKQCTLPHIVSRICSKDFEKLIRQLESDPETAGLVSSVSVAMEREADKQLAGVSSSIQIALARLNTPEIAWVMSGDDVDLNLNHPDKKAFLVVGSNPKLADSLSPVISCIITCALKQMNQPDRHHSMILLDEGPTLFIPRFEQIPATARSNKIATIFMAQDISQLVQAYGQVNAEVILGNLNSQLFGRTSNPRTAEYVSSMFGLEDRELTSKSRNSGSSYNRTVWGFPMPHYGRSVSQNLQQRPVLKPQEVMELGVGEFVGIVASIRVENFTGKVKRMIPI